MKLRIYTILSVFILSITFLMCCSSTTGQRLEETRCKSMQTVEEIKALIQMGSTVVPKDPRDKLQDVAQDIYDDYQLLCQRFEDGDFRGMADILGKKASLKTADGRYIRRRGNIEKYWKEIIDAGQHNLVEFKLVWAVIVHDERRPIFARDTDNMVYESFTYKLKNQSGEKILRNQDGEGERNGRHTLGCDWIGN